MKSSVVDQDEKNIQVGS